MKCEVERDAVAVANGLAAREDLGTFRDHRLERLAGDYRFAPGGVEPDGDLVEERREKILAGWEVADEGRRAGACLGRYPPVGAGGEAVAGSDRPCHREQFIPAKLA